MIDAKYAVDLDHSAYLAWLLLFLPVVATGVVLNRVRGIRIHLVPAASAGAVYAVSILAMVAEESAYYYFLIMTFLSAFLVGFFGKTEFYSRFIHQNQIY